MRRFRIHLSALMLAALFWAFGSLASASTSSQMDAYWSGSMGAGNVTGPSAYQGQSMGYYTGGNLSMRTPQQNLQLFGFQPPSLSAGCGGIDIFAGGFSFVNSAQLVAFMKAVASNAEGYAFNAALGFLCPTCQKWLNDLQKMAQEINATNISSCQAANALVNTAFGGLEAGAHTLCSQLGTSNGVFSDMVQGWAQCQTNSTGQLASLPASQQQFNPVSMNLAWQAIQQNAFLSSDSNFAQVVMTMTGTLVSNCTSDGAGGCTLTNLPAFGDQKSMIQALLDGGTITGLKCDDLGPCLNPTAGASYTISASSAFRVRVQTLLDDIVARILARQALTTDEQNLVAASPLPILKMAHVYATAEGVLAQQDMDNYAELIATTLVVYFIEDTVFQVKSAARNLPNANKDQISSWEASINASISNLHAFEQTVATQETAYETMIDRTQKVESTLAGDLGSRFAQSNTFFSNLAAR